MQTFEVLSDKELETALDTAETCFASWRQKSFSERAEVVVKAAVIMRTRVEEIARPVTLEMGGDHQADPARNLLGRSGHGFDRRYRLWSVRLF